MLRLVEDAGAETPLGVKAEGEKAATPETTVEKANANFILLLN